MTDDERETTLREFTDVQDELRANVTAMAQAFGRPPLTPAGYRVFLGLDPELARLADENGKLVIRWKALSMKLMNDQLGL